MLRYTMKIVSFSLKFCEVKNINNDFFELFKGKVSYLQKCAIINLIFSVHKVLVIVQIVLKIRIYSLLS